MPSVVEMGRRHYYHRGQNLDETGSLIGIRKERSLISSRRRRTYLLAVLKNYNNVNLSEAGTGKEWPVLSSE